MHKIIWLINIGLIVAFSTKLPAQNGYNIQLAAVNQPNPKLSCYDIQLASADGVGFNLAGQNYRLYYDAEQFRFNPEKMSSRLIEYQYSPLIIKDNLMDIDATGLGVLPFENHLGFVNLGTDLDDLAEGGITLPASGEWVSTAQICFDYVGATAATPKMQIVWARAELTALFATAYVEIAEWMAPFKSQPAEGVDFRDLGLSTSLEEETTENSIKVYPNPTANFITIDLIAKKATKLHIKSIDGKLIQQHTIQKGDSRFEIDLTALPSGLYNLELYGNQFITKRIEKID